MKKLITTLAAAGALASTVATSQAQIVVNGGPLTPVATPTSTGSGATVASQSPTFSTGIQDGSLSSTVLSGDLLAPVGYTGYTFVYQVSETGSTTVNTISLDGYAGLGSVFVSIVPGTGAGVPDYAQLAGDTLTIDLFPNTPTGGSSDLIYVFTSADSYGVNGATADDGVSANTTDLAPVPEPSTVMAGALMILPLGFGAFRALRKERIA